VIDSDRRPEPGALYRRRAAPGVTADEPRNPGPAGDPLRVLGRVRLEGRVHLFAESKWKDHDRIRKSQLLTRLNTGYVYPGGPFDLTQLFQEEDLTREVQHRQQGIPARLAEMRRTLATPTPPKIAPDDQCFSPYKCSFWEHCTKDKPARWIYHLPGSRQACHDLATLGAQTIDDIPSDYPLQLIQQRVKDNVEWIGPGLRAALDTVVYPVHHLDFETLGSAIPVYPNTHPYQSVPFQWSNHIETADGRLRHEAYLCPDARDPREELAVALVKSLGRQGSICTYTGYERSVLTGLAEAFPHLRTDLERVCDRLWDLHPVIKAHYYHPSFNGSYSIKAVLPAVAPHLAYDDLEIREGMMASLQFHRMAFGDGDPAEKTRLRTALLKYCERDTLAMVELRKALLAKVLR